MPRRNNRPAAQGGDPGQGALFDIEPTPASAARQSGGVEDDTRMKRPALRQRTSLASAAPKYLAYNGKRSVCELGQYLRHKGSPDGHLEPAGYRRVFRGAEVLLCSRCAHDQKLADGISGSLPARTHR